MGIILNFLLVALLFGASKKRLSPYAAATVLGVIKGILYVIVGWPIILAPIPVVVFGGLAAAMVYFMSRVDAKESTEQHFSKFGYVKKGRFKWESIPLAVSIVLLVFGEFILTMLTYDLRLP